MIIDILSDSHITSTQIQSKGYPQLLVTLEKIFKGVDHIIHAGDICDDIFINDLSKITSKTISVVAGNMDYNSKWPTTLDLEFEGIKIGVAHNVEKLALFAPNSIRVFIYAWY